MATKQLYCNPCSEELKSTLAVKYCSDCEENLCEECAGFHLRFKAFKTHHLIDLTTTGSRIPSSTKLHCEIHADLQLDFYCSQHDTVCCMACIPDHHSSCKQVYPLHVASKNVRNSALLSDMFDELRNISETLGKLLTSKGENIKLLALSKGTIVNQIREVKEQILKDINTIEQKLIEELSVVEEKNISALKSESTEMSKLNDELKSKIEELQFLKEHGSNNQLFLALQKQIPHTQKADLKLRDILSSMKEFDIRFERKKDFGIKSIGSITKITRPCDVTYTAYKSQQAQVQPDTVKSLTEFKTDGEVKLKLIERYDIRGITVTADKKLLICNWLYYNPKVYIYRDCKTFEAEITFSSVPYDIAVIPCSHRAVVTLPDEKSVQFIDIMNNTTGRKICIKYQCFGIMATKDRIYVGGDGTIHILDTNGSEVARITIEGGTIYTLHYDGSNEKILIRQDESLRCIDLHGKVLNHYYISGDKGVAVDRHGDVYVSGYDSNDIQRLSSDGTYRDTVLMECDGVKRPRFLSFNRDFTKLFIVCEAKSVLVYNCK